MSRHHPPLAAAVERRVGLAVLLAAVTACQTPPQAPSPRAAREIDAETLESQVSRLARDSRPRREHQSLDVLVGSWTIELASVDEAGAEQALAMGHGEIAWILGGRFLRWDASLSIRGRNEATTGYLGFDLNAHQYQLLMISSLASGMTIARGDGDVAGNGITLELEQFDSKAGVRRRMKSTLRALTRTHFVLDQVGADAQGVERVVRRSHYRRSEPVDSGSEQDLAPSDAPDTQRKSDGEDHGQPKDRVR